MSRFLRELEAILDERKIKSGSSIFEVAGFSRSMLSRIRAGALVEFNQIPRVAAAIAPEDMVFLRLFRGRLIDECANCSNPAATRIQIDIGTKTDSLDERQTGPDYMAKLPPAQEKALRNIAKSLASDAGLRKTILWLGAEIFGEQWKEPGGAGKQHAQYLPAPQGSKQNLTRKKKK